MKNDEYITITKESYQKMNHLLIERARQIERLQEQLNEANEVIKFYDKKEPKYLTPDGVIMGKEPAHIYLLKWGVK